MNLIKNMEAFFVGAAILGLSFAWVASEAQTASQEAGAQVMAQAASHSTHGAKA